MSRYGPQLKKTPFRSFPTAAKVLFDGLEANLNSLVSARQVIVALASAPRTAKRCSAFRTSYTTVAPLQRRSKDNVAGTERPCRKAFATS